MTLDDFFRHLKDIADRYIWIKYSTWIRCENEEVRNRLNDHACPIEAVGHAKVGDASYYSDVGEKLGLSPQLVQDIASAADVPHGDGCSCEAIGIPDQRCERRAKIRSRMMEILDLGLAS